MTSQGSVSEHKETSVIHDHHVYKDIWTPVGGEELNLITEDSNEHDKYAVSVDTRIATPTSVHVAQFTSCHAHPVVTRHLFEVRHLFSTQCLLPPVYKWAFIRENTVNCPMP